MWQSRKETNEITVDISVKHDQCTIKEPLITPHRKSLESQFSTTDPLSESSERENLRFEYATLSGHLCGFGEKREDGRYDYGRRITGYSCGGGGGGVEVGVVEGGGAAERVGVARVQVEVVEVVVVQEVEV